MLSFPFGKAPLAILLAAVLSGLAILLTAAKPQARPDLALTVFDKGHLLAYQRALPAFEREHGVRVHIQLMDHRALRSRLQSALLAGVEVPDVVELIDPTIGYFTKGPLEDVGLLDLTDRIRDEGLDQRFVPSRLALWSSRGRIFALPHDVHPVMLAYRRDIAESLGLDLPSVRTWDEFAAIGRRLAGVRNPDGSQRHFLLDLPAQGAYGLLMLLEQRGVGCFDAEGRVAFDRPEAVEVVRWCVRASYGRERVAFSAGWGQSLNQAMNDGLVLCYMAPDWRARAFSRDLPSVGGRMALMPMPAWEPGGRRTSAWGGTGVAIARSSRNPELAWALVKHLYLGASGGELFQATGIIPPLPEMWDDPAFTAPDPFYSGQPVGRLYADLAAEVPVIYRTPYTEMAYAKLDEAYSIVAAHYRSHGEKDLDRVIQAQLTRCADDVRREMGRNRFLVPRDTP